MKKTAKLILSATLALSLGVALVGCSWSNKTKETTKVDTSSVPSKDAEGKKIAEDDKSTIAETEEDNDKVSKVVGDLLGAFATYTPQNIEQQLAKVDNCMMDSKRGFYGDESKKKKVIETVISSNETANLESWNPTSFDYRGTATDKTTGKTYYACMVELQMIYSSTTDGQHVKRNYKMILGYDKEAKQWKVMKMTLVE
ncbi:hypothetical protein [Clostridium sp. C8-1-8]|uniref:hypothetical protein n=1 Tax=Clostridium sp. C8-1-8 TaxID=2698831 RepID=UPI00136E4A8E|nr:hypothetical protein [Clostridium sp. C8-1-8]